MIRFSAISALRSGEAMPTACIGQHIELAGDAPGDVSVDDEAGAEGDGQLVLARDELRTEVAQIVAFEVEGTSAAVAGVVAPVHFDEWVDAFADLEI